MTNSIGSLPGQTAGAEASQTTATQPAKPVGGVSGPATPATQGGEAVTLSADAQTTASLLNAARNADGIDAARVAQLRSAVQAGTYNVSPDDVAKAITGAAASSVGLGGGA
jgi:flagellar biosynthesis anti-sigma factor FlgM